jgi:hypothetical protein
MACNPNLVIGILRVKYREKDEALAQRKFWN